MVQIDGRRWLRQDNVLGPFLFVVQDGKQCQIRLNVLGGGPTGDRSELLHQSEHVNGHFCRHAVAIARPEVILDGLVLFLSTLRAQSVVIRPDLIVLCAGRPLGPVLGLRLRNQLFASIKHISN